MKKKICLIGVMIFLCISGCGNKDVSAENIINVEEESSSELETESETITEINPEMDACNKKVIADAMGIEEDGTEYLIYLWGNDLDCVQDLTNDKWVIRSYR
jgi:hypothetical protein